MKTIATILILGLAAAAGADTAEVDAKFFHPAASSYIQGDSTTASNLVAEGLSLHPDDGKLKRLKELLDKQQQKQNQDNKDQDKNKQDQKQKDQQSQDQKKNDQDKQKQDKQDQDKKDQPQPDQGQQEQQQQQPEPQSAEQMSPDEAKQLMDAMKQEEENKRLQLHPVMGAPVKVDKDW